LHNRVRLRLKSSSRQYKG